MKLSIDFLRGEIIGNETFFKTPYGNRVITYADYTASGKTLKFIEKYLIRIQEMYANSHTEDSFTGKNMTALVHKAESNIKKLLNANENNFIIPVGTGATGAIHKLSEILGIYHSPSLKIHMQNFINNLNDDALKEKIENERPIVFIGPYEHHSNDLIWRESLAEVVEINITSNGKIDIEDLKQKVSKPEFRNRVKIGSFSAASNITGVKSPIYEIANILHENNVYACFDFAASGPYVDIDMNRDEKSYFDAVYLSPHKYIGGPGSSGLLIINKRLYHNEAAPTVAGGGTVDYVSSLGYDFTRDVEAREKAGTPGILQIIKAALALELKEAVGIDIIEERENHLTRKVFKRLSSNPNIEILGSKDPDNRISIFSFNIKHKEDYLHHKFVAKLLNDLFGIQSRAGCACAGPYGHRLLNIDEETSEQYRSLIKDGINSLKPGWVRVNFHYTMSEEEVNFICDAIEFIAKYGYLFIVEYTLKIQNGLWTHINFKESEDFIDNFGIAGSLEIMTEDVFAFKDIDKTKEYKMYMDKAIELALELESSFNEEFYKTFEDERLDSFRWYYFSNFM